MATIIGAAGDDVLGGTGGDDLFDLSAGGHDIVHGFEGDDVFYMGGTLDAQDVINGDLGYDTVSLSGVYKGVLRVSDAMFNGVEAMTLLGGSSYRLAFAAGSVAGGDAGGRFALDARLDAGDGLKLDLSNLSAGGVADVTLEGGRAGVTGGDIDLLLNLGLHVGRIQVDGGAGDETVVFTGQFVIGDRFDGGAGHDTLVLNTSQSLILRAGMLSGVETLAFGDEGYDVRVDDANVAAGRTLRVAAENAAGGLHFDGSAEHDGAFKIRSGDGYDLLTGGDGADTLSSGDGADTLTGGLGRDQLTGGVGDDSFVYRATAESAAGGGDVITDLQAGDRIDLSQIDADLDRKGDQAFHLAATLDGHAGELILRYDGVGVTLLQADVDGDGKADFELILYGDQTGFTNFEL